MCVVCVYTLYVCDSVCVGTHACRYVFVCVFLCVCYWTPSTADAGGSSLRLAVPHEGVADPLQGRCNSLLGWWDTLKAFEALKSPLYSGGTGRGRPLILARDPLLCIVEIDL